MFKCATLDACHADPEFLRQADEAFKIIDEAMQGKFPNGSVATALMTLLVELAFDNPADPIGMIRDFELGIKELAVARLLLGVQADAPRQ